jgi:predicted Zn-dependent peptidase
VHYRRNGKTARHSSSPSLSTTSAYYKKTTLASGVRVVTEEIPHVRSVSIGFWIETGSRNESVAQNGVSHFIEHMVFKGTGKRTIKEIAQSLESVGGYLNAFTSKEHTCYYARALDEHCELCMDVLSDLAFNATFPQKELEKERGVILEELKQAEDDPDDIIHDYFEKAIFGTHSLGMPVIGTVQSIRALRRADLMQYRSDWYAAENLVIAAAGNVRHEDVVRLAEKYTKRIESGSGQKRHLQNGAVIERPASTVKEYSRPIQQAHICMGTVGYSIRSEKRFSTQVLNTLLGDGMSSRLFQNIRERYGFAYAVYSFSNMMVDTGSAGIYIGTDKSHIEQCIDLVKKELHRLRRQKVTKQELERTKAQLKGNLLLGLENIPNRMIRLGSSELYFGELIPVDAILKKTDAVRQDEVVEIAGDVFNEEKFVTVIIRPNGNAEPLAAS